MKKIYLFVLLTFIGLHLTAQYQVSTCEELELRPITPTTADSPGEDILKIYYEEDDEGIGGLGCYAHHHPNGKDFVITPYSWGREPSLAKKGLIKDAMDAISDARAEYVNYGTMENKLYYLLDNLNYSHTGIAKWIVDDSCWMKSGVPTLEGSTGDARKLIFAHEIGHCFVMENVRYLVKFYRSLNAWFDESVAEYLASEVYKEVNTEHSSAISFDLDGKAFTQPYDAYVLWKYYADKYGKSAVVPLMNQLTQRTTRGERLEFMRSSDFDQFYQHFLFDFYQLAIHDSGGGYIPNEGPTARLQYDPVTSGSSISLPDLEPERLQLFEIIIPPGHQLTLHPPEGTDYSYFQSLVVEGGVALKDWNSTVTIEGDCAYSMSMHVLMSHLNSIPLTNLEINYELKAKTDCCSEYSGTFDACLIGTWEVDIATLGSTLERDVTGTIEITFEENPTGQVTSEFQIKIPRRESANYRSHKGTLSACMIPLENPGSIKQFKLSGATLGLANTHIRYRSYNGEVIDITPDVMEFLERTTFSYKNCTPTMMFGWNVIKLNKVR
ncbi:MAG: hypothetical protein ABJJ25_07550 [Eudoraea sp.]|uniref:hypothetical protein n=1 Tax=Eudoraea sp. TaxID=1979955 RepID=UPI00326659C2